MAKITVSLDQLRRLMLAEVRKQQGCDEVVGVEICRVPTRGRKQLVWFCDQFWQHLTRCCPSRRSGCRVYPAADIPPVHGATQSVAGETPATQ